MIKMNYGDAAHVALLKRDYLKLFKGVPKMQSRWTALRKMLLKKEPSFSTLPLRVNNLLVMDFDGLADIYEQFVKLKLGSNDVIIKDAKALFAYERFVDDKGVTHEEQRTKIVSFLIDDKNGFDIHTCHYCDMAYINVYEYGREKKMHFDLDHVLDKGRCPILALSLFNLVPSCQVCNGPKIKGKRLLYKDDRLRRKLSPSNLNYDFEEKVTIEVLNTKGKSSTVDFESRMDEYEVRFNTSKDADYEAEVKAFHLNERYNYHKCEALRLLDLKERYTDARIMELARMLTGSTGATGIVPSASSLAELKRDIFAKEFGKKFHRSFGKLRDDLLG